MIDSEEWARDCDRVADEVIAAFRADLKRILQEKVAEHAV